MQFRSPIRRAPLRISLWLLCLGGCGSASVIGYRVETASGSTQVSAGDAVKLSVVETLSDGTTQPLPAGATVTWSGVPTATAVPADQATDSTPDPFPNPGPAPTAAFIANPGRSDRAADLQDVLFILDPGTEANGALTLTGTVSGIDPAGQASLTLSVGPMPAGDATRGAAVFGENGANCARCHGDAAAGSPELPDGGYAYDGTTYDYPAPGLDTEAGNLASDPSWNAPLLAMAARADVDNGGITLREPMVDFLVDTNNASGAPLTTQDFADLYAFLQTLPQP